MRRQRATSAAWTTALVLAAMVALMGIASFMAQIHRGWSPASVTSEDGAARDGSPEPRSGASTGGSSPGAPAGGANSTGPAPTGAPRTNDPPGHVAPAVEASPLAPDRAVPLLRSRSLAIPVSGLQPGALPPSSFAQDRGGRVHEALDIMAPAGTPVLAVEDGTVEKLFTSDAGGLTIYQFDPTRSVAYYYAHLQRYADGLADGERVSRGQVIGYVGSTGNARPDAPHLHFAIFVLGPEKRWWQGTAIDPALVLK